MGNGSVQYGAHLGPSNDKLVVLCVVSHCTAVELTANVVQLGLGEEGEGGMLGGEEGLQS